MSLPACRCFRVPAGGPFTSASRSTDSEDAHLHAAGHTASSICLIAPTAHHRSSSPAGQGDLVTTGTTCCRRLGRCDRHDRRGAVRRRPLRHHPPTRRRRVALAFRCLVGSRCAGWHPALAQRPSDSQRPLAVECALERTSSAPPRAAARSGLSACALDNRPVGCGIEGSAARPDQIVRPPSTVSRLLLVSGPTLAEILGAERRELSDERRARTLSRGSRYGRGSRAHSPPEALSN